jgi:phosphohistidine phosphatase SixA
MQLYLMRHAEAVSAAHWTEDDSKRPLSKKGRSLLLKAIPGFVQDSFAPKAILSSPYDRAKETAQIVAGAFPGVPVHFLPELASGARNDAFRSVVHLFKENAPLLLIGHMPDVAMFGGRMTADIDLMDGGMRTGEIVAIETGSPEVVWGQGKILWRKKCEEWIQREQGKKKWWFF